MALSVWSRVAAEGGACGASNGVALLDVVARGFIIPQSSAKLIEGSSPGNDQQL
jgi:hypothetical protein